MEIWYGFIDICKDTMNVSLCEKNPAHILYQTNETLLTFIQWCSFQKIFVPYISQNFILHTTCTNKSYTYISLKASTSRIGEMKYENIEHKKHD